MASHPDRRLRVGPTTRIALTLLVVWGLGTTLLTLPIATVEPANASWLTAAFTAASALTVTGLIVVDTPTYWTSFGHVVILGLIQIGGLGVMLISTLLALTVSRRLGIGMRMGLQTEFRNTAPGGQREVLGIARRIIIVTVCIETTAAIILALRLGLTHHLSAAAATWNGVFLAISGFNNAGFSLWTDSLMGHQSDPWILLPIALAVIIGGLGFPVIAELQRQWDRPLTWHLTTRVVVVMTPLLLVTGTVFIYLQERGNPATLGQLSTADAWLNAFFQSTITRTAGFNSIDIGAMHPATWLGMDMGMFIGAGPAGTASGIKVTTIMVVLAISWTEVTGGRAVNVLGKRIGRSVHRQALTLMTLASGLVALATFALMLLQPDLGLDALLFEAVSAFGTVGLSTGITADLGAAGELILMLLMFAGRLGPVTLASALALRPRTIHYELPRERLLIG